MIKQDLRWARTSAGVGAVVCGLLWLGEWSLLEKVLALGIAVIVPLGLSFVPQAELPAAHGRLFGLWVRAQPLCAASALASIYWGKWGVGPALLAGAWWGLTVLGASIGLLRWRARRWALDSELAIDAALAYLVVGSVWFVSARAGYRLLGFDALIVFLTAVHFHFAGFAAPLITGLLGRILPPEALWGHKLLKWAAAGIIVLPGVIAVAFSRVPLLEWIAVLLFAGSLALVGAIMLFSVAPRQKQVLHKGLFAVAGLSLWVSMFFACLYAYGKYTGTELIGISMMARTHGVINALGFAACGLAACAWSLWRDGETTDP